MREIRTSGSTRGQWVTSSRPLAYSTGRTSNPPRPQKLDNLSRRFLAGDAYSLKWKRVVSRSVRISSGHSESGSNRIGHAGARSSHGGRRRGMGYR